MAEKIIDAKYLKDLTFKGSKAKTVTEDGTNRMVYEPFERDLVPEDVLAVRDDGENMIFVTADGQKYTVKKQAGKA